MTKMNDQHDFDLNSAMDALGAIVSGEEPEQAPEYETEAEAAQDVAPKRPVIEPIDLFGDTSLTGRQELTADMLPPAIYNYAREVSEIMGINAGPIALGCLVSAATAIREGWVIQPKLHDLNWREKPILWGAISGSSGAKKTSALNAGTLPLDRLEKDWAELGEEEMKEYRREKAQYNEEMKGWRKACQALMKEGGNRDMFPEMPEAPEKPARPRMVVKDTTIEKVMEVCSENPAGIVQVRDELTEWIGSFDLYSGGSGSRDRAKYLTAYNGGSESVDRKSDEDGPLRVDSFAVSIVGGIQDDILRKDFSNTKADGFLARFLFVKAEIRPGCDRRADPKAVEGYLKLIRSIALNELQAENGEIDGVVSMSPEAAEVRERIECLSRALNDSPMLVKGLSDHLNKWPGIFSRLCLVFHMIEAVQNDFRPQKQPVSGKTAEAVYRLLTEYFLPEAARIYNEVMQGDEATGHAKWIAGHILAHGKERISTFDIRRAFSSIKDDFRAIEAACQKLELMAWITPDGKRGARTDFAKMKWRVNKRVHQIFAERAEIERQEREATKARIQQGAAAMRDLQAKVKR